MPTTVAIPDCIVGDTPTIRERKEDSTFACASIARCCARRIAQDGEIGPYFTAELLEEGARNAALLGESVRRHEAERLAHAIQPDEGFWR